MENLCHRSGCATQEDRHRAVASSAIESSVGFPYHDASESSTGYSPALLHPGVLPATPRLVETGGIREPLPIWLAVLFMTSFQAKSSRRNHTVRWHCASGRATYTNSGNEDERIEPLGVSLPVGQTLAVSWVPGGTTYTIEVF
jgi:hypothetical protein